MTEKKKPESVKSTDVIQAQTGALRTFVSIPKEIEAVQFRGWSNAPDIFQVMPCFYVPQGWTHPLRPNSEYDATTGKILETAPEFLIIMGDSGADRVDLFEWLIIDRTKKTLNIWNDEAFTATYSEKVIA